MTAIFFYKVLKEFALEVGEENLQIGSEIFLPQRDGEKLVAGGYVTQGRALNPDSVDDAAKIKEAEDKHDAKYAIAKKADQDRDEQKDGELKEDDKYRKELLTEAKDLYAELEAKDGEDHSKHYKDLTLQETEDIEVEIEKLKSMISGEEIAEETTDEDDEEDTEEASTITAPNKKTVKGNKK